MMRPFRPVISALIPTLAVALLASGSLQSLKEAAREGDVAAVKRLLDAGADPNEATGMFPTTPLQEVCKESGSAEVISLLIEAGADVNLVRAGDLISPLIFASEKGFLGAVELLVNAGADLDHQRGRGNTALIEAIDDKHVDVAELLIESGADVNLGPEGAYTALMRAARQGNLGLVRLLLEAGADPRALTENGSTALGLARGDAVKSEIREATRKAPVAARSASSPRSTAAQSRSYRSETDAGTGAVLNFMQPCPQGWDAFLSASQYKPFNVSVTVPDIAPFLDNDRFQSLINKAIEFGIKACRDVVVLRVDMTFFAPGYDGPENPAATAIHRRGMAAATERPLETRNFALAGEFARRANERGQAFLEEHGVEALPSLAAIVGNPFNSEGQIVALKLVFETMESADTGVFGGDAGQVVISGIPRGTFSATNQEACVAAMVIGKTQLGTTGRSVSHLEFRGAYLCLRPNCAGIDLTGPRRERAPNPPNPTNPPEEPGTSESSGF